MLAIILLRKFTTALNLCSDCREVYPFLVLVVLVVGEHVQGRQV